MQVTQIKVNIVYGTKLGQASPAVYIYLFAINNRNASMWN